MIGHPLERSSQRQVLIERADVMCDEQINSGQGPEEICLDPRNERIKSFG
jgi:hypothetical protein